jgi:hypothetical protein
MPIVGRLHAMKDDFKMRLENFMSAADATKSHILYQATLTLNQVDGTEPGDPLLVIFLK